MAGSNPTLTIEIQEQAQTRPGSSGEKESAGPSAFAVPPARPETPAASVPQYPSKADVPQGTRAPAGGMRVGDEFYAGGQIVRPFAQEPKRPESSPREDLLQKREAEFQRVVERLKATPAPETAPERPEPPPPRARKPASQVSGEEIDAIRQKYGQAAADAMIAQRKPAEEPEVKRIPTPPPMPQQRVRTPTGGTVPRMPALGGQGGGDQATVRWLDQKLEGIVAHAIERAVRTVSVENRMPIIEALHEIRDEIKKLGMRMNSAQQSGFLGNVTKGAAAGAAARGLGGIARGIMGGVGGAGLGLAGLAASYGIAIGSEIGHIGEGRDFKSAGELLNRNNHPGNQ